MSSVLVLVINQQEAHFYEWVVGRMLHLKTLKNTELDQYEPGRPRADRSGSPASAGVINAGEDDNWLIQSDKNFLKDTFSRLFDTLNAKDNELSGDFAEGVVFYSSNFGKDEVQHHLEAWKKEQSGSQTPKVQLIQKNLHEHNEIDKAVSGLVDDSKYSY
jgi:hypothetical protein